MSFNENISFEPLPGSQEMYLTCTAWEVMYHAGRGNGKGQINSAKILTPRGWTTMGKLRPGSIISNPDGEAQQVLQVIPRGEQTVYKVSFKDGSHVITDSEHLWLMRYANREKRWIRRFKPQGFYGEIESTENMYKHLLEYPDMKPLIPCTSPVFFQKPKGAIDVDAYLIGLLIGDGSLSRKNNITLSTADYEIVEYIHDKGFNTDIPEHSISYRCYNNTPIHKQIIKLKLLGTHSHTKFIPKRLLFGSIEERLATIQGLMDSDGYVDKVGGCYYTTVSQKLSKDIKALILSLGGWASIREKETQFTNTDGELKTGRLAYELYIQFPNKVDLCRLSRKKERCIGNNYMHGALVRTICKIEKLEKKEKTICIVVKNPNRLYITDDYIVTHNSVCLLMDYLQHVDEGLGLDWAGVIFRQSYPQLQDFVAVTHKWIPRIFPDAKYNGSEHTWTFREGESLMLRYVRRMEDYEQYHGWQKSFVGFEELSLWSTPELYLKLMSINRCPNENVRLKYRSTTNPGGAGNFWLRERFIDAAPPQTIIKSDIGQSRCHIKGDLRENTVLLKADPFYREKLMSLAKDNPNLYKAWVLGSWDIITGGALTDVWDIESQRIPVISIPDGWKIFRGFDWGSARPWAVLYIAECNGEQPSDFTSMVAQASGKLPHFARGSCVVIDEIYGWNGTPNEGDVATSQEIAERVLEKDRAIELEHGIKVQLGPADTSIYDVRDGSSIGSNLSSHGCYWTRAYKGSGSRIAGLAIIRQMLGASKRHDLEKPGLYFFEKVFHTLRTLPILQLDKIKYEDVDTNMEDHIYDVLRYMLSRKMSQLKQRVVGM